MSSGFSLIFVSFSSEVPHLLVRRLDLLFMSAPFRLRLAELFRHGDGSGVHAPLPAADPDREHNMFAVNADALVRLTHAVLAAIGSTSAPRRQQPRLALRRAILRGEVSNLPQAF
jgi:hypothetical protein